MAPRYSGSSFDTSISSSSSGSDWDWNDWPDDYSSSSSGNSTCDRKCKIIFGSIFGGIPALILSVFILVCLWSMLMLWCWEPAVKKVKERRERRVNGKGRGMRKGRGWGWWRKGGGIKREEGGAKAVQDQEVESVQSSQVIDSGTPSGSEDQTKREETDGGNGGNGRKGRWGWWRKRKVVEGEVESVQSSEIVDRGMPSTSGDKT